MVSRVATRGLPLLPPQIVPRDNRAMGWLLAMLRLSMGLSAAEVADRLFYARTTVANRENGRVASMTALVNHVEATGYAVVIMTKEEARALCPPETGHFYRVGGVSGLLDYARARGDLPPAGSVADSRHPRG